MIVEELIKELEKYPKDMIVATIEFPFDELEIHIAHYYSESPRIEDFDFVAIE